MNIEIKNLGFIKQVNVDLSKDLIILCGPNNTGKTYLAYLLYGIHKSKVSALGVENLFNLKTISENYSIDLTAILELHKETIFNTLSKLFISDLSGIFATNKENFAKCKINITYKNLQDLLTKMLSHKMKRTYHINRYIKLDVEKNIGSSILNFKLISSNDKPSQNFEFLSPIYSHIIFTAISDILFSNAYIAPVERIAINIFSKELSLKRNELVDQLLELKEAYKKDDPLDLLNRRAMRYPLPVRDGLELSEDLTVIKKNTSEFEQFADEIEADILKGKILISKEGEVQFKPDSAKSLRLPTHMSASVVKSLSNLVIYFRHLAQANDFIIIDEPELNLHPDNQVIIARIIAKIVNKGFKVLISTHSDYIIKELNNLIMLSKDSNLFENFPEYNNRNLALSPDKIEAILFRYDKAKTENLKITQDGFGIETIDEVINQLNTRSQKLYFN